MVELNKYLTTGSGIKTIREKTGFLEFIWKLESWEVNLRIGILETKFETNWNFENYLRIEVLKIKFKNWNFGN